MGQPQRPSPPGFASPAHLAHSATQNVLDVRHLSVQYRSASGAVHAVDDVSFTLPRGSILGLAGESGSGKSTLAYAVARLLRPPARVTGGQVLYTPGRDLRSAGADEQYEAEVVRHERATGAALEDPSRPVDVLALSDEQLRAFRWRTLAFVFQSAMNALNPVLTVQAQIDDVLRAHYPTMTRAERRRRATELVRLVGIATDRLSSYPHELSGGMRQRAVIAIALALNPEVLILDEPTTALDVVVQRDILAEVLALREQLGFSVIFITHDLSLLLEVADRIAIMYAGRMVELADSQTLYARACHPYTFGLLHSFPALRGLRKTLAGIPGSPPDLRAVPPGCAFHPRCGFAMPACSTQLPLLRPQPAATAAAPGARASEEALAHLVACHLFDPAVNPDGPPEPFRSYELPPAAGAAASAGGGNGAGKGEIE